MWCKLTGQLSHNNPRLRLHLSPNYFHREETKPAEKSYVKNFTFSSLSLYMEEKELVLLSPVIVTLKSWSEILPQKYKKVDKICFQLALIIKPF